MASKRTDLLLRSSVIIMLVSLPISYIVQAPTEGVWIPGFHLGAMGMGVKMVVFNMLSVNLYVFMFARLQGWKFDWLFQFVSIGIAVGSGFLSRWAVHQFVVAEWFAGKASFLVPFTIATLFHAVILFLVFWIFPGVTGLSEEDKRNLVTSARARWASYWG